MQRQSRLFELYNHNLAISSLPRISRHFIKFHDSCHQKNIVFHAFIKLSSIFRNQCANQQSWLQPSTRIKFIKGVSLFYLIKTIIIMESPSILQWIVVKLQCSPMILFDVCFVKINSVIKSFNSIPKTMKVVYFLFSVICAVVSNF